MNKGNAAINKLFGDGGDVGFGPAQWGNDGIPQTRKVQFCAACNTHYSVEALSCPHCRVEAQAARERRVMLRVRGSLAHKRTQEGHCKYCGERFPRKARGAGSGSGGQNKEVCNSACYSAFWRLQRKGTA